MTAGAGNSNAGIKRISQSDSQSVGGRTDDAVDDGALHLAPERADANRRRGSNEWQPSWRRRRQRRLQLCDGRKFLDDVGGS